MVGDGFVVVWNHMILQLPYTSNADHVPSPTATIRSDIRNPRTLPKRPLLSCEDRVMVA
jgi:hypothetical protein